MGLKTIKISEDNYKKLNMMAGLIRTRENRPISISETLSELLVKKNSDIMRFAGSWKMTDKEFEKINEDLEKLWKNWKMEL